MWDFLWHLRGSIPLDGIATNQEALDRIEWLLSKQRKPVTDRGPDLVAFEDPLWEHFWEIRSNWLAMVLYDKGRFAIERGLTGRRLRYDLRSLHGFVFCLFGALMFFLFGAAGGGILNGLAFAALAFGWIYGMNIALALVRVPRSIRKAVRRDSAA